MIGKACPSRGLQWRSFRFGRRGQRVAVKESDRSLRDGIKEVYFLLPPLNDHGDAEEPAQIREPATATAAGKILEALRAATGQTQKCIPDTRLSACQTFDNSLISRDCC
jgi:hypothetical protein